MFARFMHLMCIHVYRYIHMVILKNFHPRSQGISSQKGLGITQTTFPSKNCMGPNPNGPRSVSYYCRAIKYSGFFRGPCLFRGVRHRGSFPKGYFSTVATCVMSNVWDLLWPPRSSPLSVWGWEGTVVGPTWVMMMTRFFFWVFRG